MRNPFRSRRPSAPAPAPAPVVRLQEPQEAELRRVARDLVWPGFVELDHVVVVLEDHELADTGVRVDPRAQADAAARIAREEWDRRAAEVVAAPDGGDHDRLAAAFDALARDGVLARMAFTCCNTCGTDEIDGERTPLAVAGDDGYGWAEWAYTFFHEQDAERLLEAADGEAVLHLTFSAFRPAPDVDPAALAASRAGDAEAKRRVWEHTDRAVGRLVHDALVGQGLDVDWDGTAGQRIRVRIRDWSKPLPVG